MATKERLDSADIFLAESSTRTRVHRKPQPPRAIQNAQRAVPLQLARFETFLHQVHRELGLSADSCFVRFVTDSEMLRLNDTFRHKPRTTDVLSFPSESRTRPGNLARRVYSLRGQFLGDIAISPKVARRNVRAFHRTMATEICMLILHGVLHLLGYDHETDRGEMERVEARLHRRLGLT
jgi:probable rRNA maturation factor